MRKNKLKQKTYTVVSYFFTFDASTGRVSIFEDISQTRGTPFVSGTNGNSTPEGEKMETLI